MIARVPAGRDAEVKVIGRELPPQANHLPPRPGQEMVFTTKLERRPGGDKRDHSHFAPKSWPQILRKRLGQERYLESLAGSPEKRRGHNQVAQLPKLHH